jgi:uncharacterized repeat protein (TIGR01451 family)
MRRSVSIGTFLVCSLLFLFLRVSNAQTSCDTWDYGLPTGILAGTVESRMDTYCNSSPQNLVSNYADGLVVTKHNVYNCTSPSCSKSTSGGTDTCTNFPKQIVITFSRPVADFSATVYGARTVTANTGQTVTIAPNIQFEGFSGPTGSGGVFFEGGGITSITLSDPFEYDLTDGLGLYATGAWEMWMINATFNSEPKHNSCNCARPAIATPPTQTASGHGWSMQVEVSANDGLVLHDVKLNDRYMAEKISVPYYWLQTSALANQRGELKPNSSDPSLRSRLVEYYVVPDDKKLVVQATYVIDQIPAGSQSCLHIIQRYEFYKQVPGDQCEPSGKLPCARWKPIVKYQFFGQNSETLTSINIAQRQHRMIENYSDSTVGLFLDNDVPGLGGLQSGSVLFARKWNPLDSEWADTIIKNGKQTRKWDNIHQTYAGVVDEPWIDWTLQNWDPRRPGCPECIHSHWRWGTFTFGEGRGELVGIPGGSTQDVDFGVVLYQSGEDDPMARYDDLVYGLVQYWQPIRTYNIAGRSPLQIYRDSAPENVVYWQSATGHQDHDTFFAYGGFLNPNSEGHEMYDSPMPDGVKTVAASQIYVQGSTNVASFDSSLAGPLPAGYTQYGNFSYDVTSTFEASGPNTVTFSVSSVPDQNVFNSLRVFHLEADPYDPAAVAWVDRTVLPPDPQAPDFASKTINAKTNSLGQFVLAALTDPQPPNTAVADISVNSSHSPASVIAGNQLTYTFNVANSGPQDATGVVFSNTLSPQTRFVSVNSNQGTCTETDATVACKLGTIASGTSTVVTIVTDPLEGKVPLPAQGKTVNSTAHAKANETDADLNNNSAGETVTILPDGNAAPSVDVTTPIFGALFVGPANINVTASANDTDGSVSKVDFYGDGDLIGTATATPYSVTWNNVSFGPHSLTAVATDNLNKMTVSDPIALIVNGSATVNITSPTWWGNTFNAPPSIPITATATLTSGTIAQVDFFADQRPIGTGTLSGPDQYSITWSAPPTGCFALTAVATDNSGVTTTSNPVNILVNDPPAVSLLNPASGALFNAPATITVTSNASDGDGSIQQVKFYSNGSLIGTSHTTGANQFSITWSNVAAGSYSLTAVATDNLGGTTTSVPVNVVVNAPPAVSLTNPANGAVFAPPASMTITATATDSDGSVSGVSFYSNGNFVGNGAFTAPDQYSFTWNNVTAGNYNLTARATDDRGATTTSNSRNINVDNPPTVSITSPTNGATFAAPASIAINTNAADSDGFVSKVEFFKNSIKIGETNTTPFNFTWSSVPPGSYALTTVATDNLGVTTTSAPVNITVSRSALFVTGSTTLNTAEMAVKTRLQNLGYVVTVKDAKSSVAGDASGKTVVVISSTSTSNNLGSKFTNVTVPVVIWQPLSFADLGMVPTGNSNRGTTTSQTQVKIILPTHALAGGLTGTQTVVTASGTFSWGKPNANAASVATLASDTTKIIIFGYTQGASMPGLVAPARRVGSFMSDTTAASFNTNGWTLFDAAINWATGTGP